ncbi:MAG: response regulator, partial [Ignavibacteriae bacterium]|nr:response regulator [Ignavibacteriota bacterium]
MTNLPDIVLVEDNPNDVELILSVMEEYHIVNDVIVLRDGSEALDYLKRQGKYKNRRGGNPLLVLLDLNLPIVDGRQVLRSMRIDSRLKHIPVVMLTVSREQGDVEESFTLGANVYAAKPIDFYQFADIMKQLGLG